jgi:dihydromethanopterin reductase (acceptor)
MKRIAWGITGAGHFLAECADLLTSLGNVDVFLSKAAEEVLRMYRLESKISQVSTSVIRDNMASAPIVARFARGVYRVLIIAPATSNSVAKFAYGISDSLISNIFAQTGKSQVPIVVLPTDVAAEMDSEGPSGRLVKVYPRPVDLENVDRLRRFPGVTVVKDMEELRACLDTYS